MEEVRFKSTVVAEVYEGDKLVGWRETDNFLTEVGEALIADRLAAAPDLAAPSHMGIGIGTGQTRADTALDNQVQRVALDATYPLQGSGTDDNDWLFKATFPGTSAYQISEGGIFNAASGGTMLNYFMFSPPITKSATQTLILNVTITCGYS